MNLVIVMVSGVIMFVTIMHNTRTELMLLKLLLTQKLPKMIHIPWTNTFKMLPQ